MFMIQITIFGKDNVSLVYLYRTNCITKILITSVSYLQMK